MIVRLPFTTSRSAAAASDAGFVESYSYSNVEEPENVVAATASDWMLFPGESVPPARTFTTPPIAPEPPTSALLCTVTAVVPRDPFTESRPADTVVGPE